MGAAMGAETGAASQTAEGATRTCAAGRMFGGEAGETQASKGDRTRHKQTNAPIAYNWLIKIQVFANVEVSVAPLLRVAPAGGRRTRARFAHLKNISVGNAHA